MPISKRAKSITASPTLAISAKAKEMKAAGIDVIGFGAGEPDFDTPTHIKEAAKEAIDAGLTKYTPASGTLKLREAICKKLRQENGLEYSASDCLISCGAKHSLFNIIFALVDEGDEVIIPAPYWVSYPEMVKMTGAEPVYVETTESSNFSLKPERLKAAITPRTKLLILNSPSNPTGAVYGQEELKKIVEAVKEHSIFLLSDEIYEKLIYDGKEHFSPASFDREIKERTITVNGVSKAYAMTGWRIGYAVGPSKIIKAASQIQSHTTSNPTSISQEAAYAAIAGSQEEVEKMRVEFDSRRKYMVERLNRIKGVSCSVPYGAFYAFANFSSFVGKGEIVDDSALASYLLEEAKVAVVPGSAFGAPGYLRFSYATSFENIKEGLDRIRKAISFFGGKNGHRQLAKIT
ncbi:pyridoxal phosphate-dependent aminotransferase [bacterium]|nr:pyridoxal phosphate-dependent aminotransferase [bacterium]